jgi:hypothetical protein
VHHRVCSPRKVLYLILFGRRRSNIKNRSRLDVWNCSQQFLVHYFRSMRVISANISLQEAGRIARGHVWAYPTAAETNGRVSNWSAAVEQELHRLLCHMTFLPDFFTDLTLHNVHFFTYAKTTISIVAAFLFCSDLTGRCQQVRISNFWFRSYSYIMRRTTVFYFRTCTLSNTTEKNFVRESSLDNNFNPCTGVLFTSLDTLEKYPNL